MDCRCFLNHNDETQIQSSVKFQDKIFPLQDDIGQEVLEKQFFCVPSWGVSIVAGPITYVALFLDLDLNVEDFPINSALF